MQSPQEIKSIRASFRREIAKTGKHLKALKKSRNRFDKLIEREKKKEVGK